MSKYFLCLVILATSTSCGSGTAAKPSERFPFAYVQPTCGPADGSALAFYFTSKETKGETFTEPFILISLNEDLPKTAPRDYSIRQGNYAMLASRCMSAGQCAAATSGTLHLTKFADGKGASGNYELHFKDGTVESSSFDATWRAVKQLLCG